MASGACLTRAVAAFHPYATPRCGAPSFSISTFILASVQPNHSSRAEPERTYVNTATSRVGVRQFVQHHFVKQCNGVDWRERPESGCEWYHRQSKARFEADVIPILPSSSALAERMCSTQEYYLERSSMCPVVEPRANRDLRWQIFLYLWWISRTARMRIPGYRQVDITKTACFQFVSVF
jgi:hypothetical protein